MDIKRHHCKSVFALLRLTSLPPVRTSLQFTYLALLISYVYTVSYAILWYLIQLIMYTYLALLISYVFTIFYIIHCIFVRSALTLLVHMYIVLINLCVLGICCVIC